MENMNSWDVVLLVVAGYLATTALVRLMVRRRDQVLNELRQQFERKRGRKEANMRERDNSGQRSKAA